ncbi:MAG: antibiotic ABC transporter ATP-binding protein [Nitrospinae bacterium RIFCSPLOWO2_02_FULL_39_110]|nr:MAG: antibiotic ABC transporter ATP-binding protein [Nitrospinae bacterium RIFCSPHIGHO2_12_FULL_39_42]OGW01132.1 MAG: antibiotic ABC transporter ATP-binding protein [Nitrospinae bacterium RIFCSPHIGHO2_02_FULL_39_82]OGW04813.1 MAG: antibiotic ABC transporter ATP-binding protein [Nitrospinae bacterium RIFCSPLOWO2_02_FULL_39_110]OGW06861.1 MAG: antibiotic ABC transporter ATP-binding protein [Nitrospinae bacterium RIFCSPLOWO2_02_39_17]OGW10136.1 MAG: antibiotic ABC transporter ATP-binding protei
MQIDIYGDEIVGKAYNTSLMRRLLKFFKPYQNQLALSLILLVAVSILQLSGPYLTKIAIDDHIVKDDWEGLSLIMIIYFALLLLSFILQYIQIYIMQIIGQKTMYDIRICLFSHIQKMSLSFFNRNPIGRLVTRVVNDVEVLNEMFTQGIVVAVGDLLILIGITIAMLVLNFRLALLTFIVIPPLLYATKIYSDRARDSYRGIRTNLARLNSYLQENVSGMSTVQVFNREDESFRRFEIINRENRDELLRSLIYNAIYFPCIELFSAITIGIIIWYGGGEVIRGGVQLGVLVAFIQYVQRFFQPIRDFAEKYNIMQAAMASSERIFKLIDTPEEIPNPQRPVISDKLRGEIEFRDVWFSYNSEGAVLKGVSFHLKAGESIAIVGATGTGKTSIINLLGRFYDIQRGMILIDGIDIREMDKNFLRKQMGIVLQDVFLFAGDIENNIRLREDSIPVEMVYEAARYVNAHEFIMKLPKGYKEDVLERGSSLSLGQKQLISFARALVFNPRILILDEATSSVDTETEIFIRDALRKLIKNRTSIIIAHRLSTVRYADRIIVIQGGEVAETGSHEELIKSRGIYYRLYQLQFER